ncbi:helix-turn-helix domain-containing protein [Patescibacteria group bacterium]|jgi:hypothetical protein|nr:helix-turn-helix domain-containing protein [Patescibacteria group bacterium]
MGFVTKRLNAPGRLGPDLIELREGVGLTVEEAAGRTKIAPSVLKALENEDWADLPDPVYAERLLKSYVSFFGANESYYLHKFREGLEAREIVRDRSTLLPRPMRIGAHEMAVTPRILAALGFMGFTLLLGGYVFAQARAMSVAPPLELFAPADGEKVDDPLVVVKGKTLPGSSVTVNGAPAVVGDDGMFEYRLNVPRGTTVIRIVARRRHGNESAAARRVIYDRPLPKQPDES